MNEIVRVEMRIKSLTAKVFHCRSEDIVIKGSSIMRITEKGQENILDVTGAMYYFNPGIRLIQQLEITPNIAVYKEDYLITILEWALRNELRTHGLIIINTSLGSILDQYLNRTIQQSTELKVQKHLWEDTKRKESMITYLVSYN